MRSHASLRFQAGLRSIVGACLVLAGAPHPSLGDVKPPAMPAKVSVSVAPEGVTAGGSLAMRLDLEPIPGVKINRYPKVKLEVPAHPGLNAAAQASVGNDAPPPADKMKTNYFDGFDGLELRVAVEAGAPAGNHEIEGKLTYFYCMPESGFCAPHRSSVKIPLRIH